MAKKRKRYTARQKLIAVAHVYDNTKNIAQICDRLHISRTTWYRWEAELKAAIQSIWGGLARAKPQGFQKNNPNSSEQQP